MIQLEGGYRVNQDITFYSNTVHPVYIAFGP